MKKTSKNFGQLKLDQHCIFGLGWQQSEKEFYIKDSMLASHAYTIQ